MPKGEKRLESSITGSLVAQAMLDILFASYLACAYFVAFSFQEPFATLSNSCMDMYLYA
jgi:hypothetical protein